MTETKTALLLGNFRPTVSVARTVAGLSYRVVVTRELGGFAAVSNRVSEVWEHKNPIDDPRFIDELAEFLTARPDISTVIPVSETSVMVVARNRAKFPADRTYATPGDEVVLQCLDKIGMLDFVDRLGIPSAAAKVVTDYQALLQAVQDIGFPLVVRPVSSSLPLFGRKAMIAHSQSDLDTQLPGWPDGHDDLIIQHFVSGPRFNVDFVAQKGRMIRAVATQILRTDSYDGTGIDVCGRTLPLADDLREFSERIIAELNYSGVGLVQFMVDRDRNDISFLELNPRFNGNCAVPERAGLEFGRLAIALAEDPDREEQTIVSDGGLRHAWLFGDIGGIRNSLKRGIIGVGAVPGALFRAVRDAVTADFHVIWSWKDPKPALMQIVIFMRRRRA